MEEFTDIMEKMDALVAENKRLKAKYDGTIKIIKDRMQEFDFARAEENEDGNKLFGENSPHVKLNMGFFF